MDNDASRSPPGPSGAGLRTSSGRTKRASMNLSSMVGAPQGSAEPKTQMAQNQARKADVYAVGRIVAARAQRDAQGSVARSKWMKEADGIPLKELLQMQYRLTRNKIIKDFCIFLIQFAMLMSACYNVFDVHESFAANDAIRQRLIQGAIPANVFKKTFEDAGTISEVHEFFSYPACDTSNLPGPFLSTMFPRAWYDGALFTEPEMAYIMDGKQRLLGGIEIRVVRVADQSCTAIAALPGPNPSACYAPFSRGQAFTGVLNVNGTNYDFGSTSVSDLRGRFGEVRMLHEVNYGNLGYRTVLKATDFNAAADQMLQYCRDGLFEDPGIRAIAATFNLYNTNTRFVTVVRIMVEVLETSYLIPSSILFTVPVPELFITNTRDKILIALLVLYMLGWIYYIQKEARRFWYYRPRYTYFFSPQNIFEVALQLVSSVFIIMYITYIINGLGPTSVDVNNPQYVDMFDYAWHFTDTFLWAGVTGLLSSLKVFRYLSINKRMNTLWLTLARAKYDLFAFSVGLLVCLVAFSFFGTQAFGYRLKDYKDFASASATLMQYILGMFSYTELADARPYIAWSFFGLYVCVVNIVFINLIISIVSKYFQEVHEEVNRVDKWKLPTSRLEQEILSTISNFFKGIVRGVMLNCCCCFFARGKRLLNKRGLCWCTTITAMQSCWQRKSCKAPPAQKSVPCEDPAEEEERMEAEQREAEKLFWKRMQKAANVAKRSNYVDLFVYFERLYEDTTGSDALYIGMDELCSLIRPFPCLSTGHTDCEARLLMDAYTDLKHMPLKAALKQKSDYAFRAYLVNRIGLKIERHLVVDHDRGLLLILSLHSKLLRQLPLTQLIQVERSESERDQINLVFTSQGVPPDEEDTLGSLEIVLRVKFKAGSRQEEFLEIILQTQAHLAEQYQKIMNNLNEDEQPPALPNYMSAVDSGPRSDRTLPVDGYSIPANRSGRSLLAPAENKAPISSLLALARAMKEKGPEQAGGPPPAP